MNTLQNVGAHLAEQSLETMISTGANPIAMGAQSFSNLRTLSNALGRPGFSQDGISRFQPPAQLGSNALGMLSNFNPLNPLGSIGNLIQALIGQLQQLQQSQNPFGDQEGWYGNASAGSNGDPHLSFNGNTWDSMVPHADLLHSDSIHGGFQLSTDTTSPTANGVTYNRQATVATNFGNSSVSLDNAGNAVATIDGQRMTLAPGQSIDLGAGTSATRNQDGSLTVVSENRRGGVITTTMRDNGQGVDVNATANNVDLGGDLVNGQNGTQPIMYPFRRETLQHQNTALDYGTNLDFN